MSRFKRLPGVDSLFVNKGDGTFEDQGLQLGVAYDETARAVSSMGSDAKDYNNDGKVDIFCNNLMGQIWALFQNSGHSFRYVSPQARIKQLSAPLSGWSAGSSITTMTAGRTCTRPTAASIMSSRTRGSTMRCSRTWTTSNSRMYPANNGNHCLVLELIGRYSNRDAIGAKVKVTAASGRVLYNHVSVSVGFISSSDKRVHFRVATGETR